MILVDIMGINFSVCVQYILMEEEAKAIRDPQNELNPAMKEVVMNEIPKLLDLGIIYQVFNSKWVSPVHV